jgi:hypothetical protein
VTENDEESVVVADEGPGTTGTSAVNEGIRETHVLQLLQIYDDQCRGCT